MSRARELAKVGGKNQQIIAGLSSHVGVSTFAEDVFMYSDLEVQGTTTFSGGTLTLGNANTDNVVFGGEVDSNIIPDDDGTYDLGSSSKEWKDLFIDGTAHIDTLDVDANAGIIGDLTVTGTATFNTALANSNLANSSVSYGGVSLSLGGSDSTPAFDLQDATGYPTSSLTGTITNAQLAGSIANDKLAGSIANGKLANSTVSYGGISLALGASDATPAFDLTDATNYPTSSLTGTITNTQLAGSIANGKLSNSTVSYGGISLSLGGSDATPAFDLTDATNYPTSSLTGTITNTQLAGSIANGKLSNSTVSYGGISLSLGGSDATPAFDLQDATNYPTSSLSGTITNAQLAGSIANDKLAGSIANGKLANSSVSYGGISLSLGGSDATPAFDLTDATNYPTSSLTGTITNTQLAGSIANSKLSNSSITIGSDSIALGGSQTDINGLTSLDVDNVTIDGNTVTTSSGNLTIDSNGGTTTIADNAVISGNLTVNGTTTTINSTTVAIDDKNFQVATGAADDAAANGAGFTVDSGDGDKTFNFEATGDNWGASENLNLASGKAYKINNTSILNATTLGSSVVASSLTSVGTIATGVWQGTAINDTYLGTIDNANKVSLSALNIDGGTDIGAALVDADEFIVDDGGGGTNRRSDMSRIKTYIYGALSSDLTASSSGAVTLASTGVSANSYGGSSAIPVITVNAKGLITSATTTSIDSTQIAQLNTSVACTDTGSDGLVTVTADGSTVAVFDQSLLTVTGNILPDANGTRNLGASGTRWANVYSSDLDLSNQAKGANSVDGTWGSYLIEEGEDHLYLTNRRSGKKFRFMLEEV
ncbi:MAG: hypothetical protein CBC22_00365 [Alphaproteobacteria bacterium TMED62]|nr:MAG: hypothetical protein CBC22_00365 [Alphaproteobacteria bacterium TMED62]